MDQRTLMLAGLITESEYRKSKENQSSLNENGLKSKIKNMIRESLSEMDMGDKYTDVISKWGKQGLSKGNYTSDEEIRYDENGNEDPNGMYDAGDNYLGPKDQQPFVGEAKKKDKEEEPEEELDADLEDMDLEDEPMDDEMMDEEPEGGTDLNDIENHLDSALEAAKQSGDEKLITQIENTITMLTRMQFNK